MSMTPVEVVFVMFAGSLVGGVFTHRVWLRRMRDLRLQRVEDAFTLKPNFIPGVGQGDAMPRCMCGHLLIDHQLHSGVCVKNVDCHCVKYSRATVTIA